MIKRYANTLLASSSHGAKMAQNTLHREHELALMMRNIAELFVLSGHSLRRSLRMNVTRKKYRREMRRLRAEELTSEKKEFIKLADASFHLKADVVQAIGENKTLEEENEKLKAALAKKKEKKKVKTLRERNVLLDNDLYDKTLKNDRLHIELTETY
ncbi:hypothetical protein Dimus_013186 [Dionaea muscipula]